MKINVLIPFTSLTGGLRVIFLYSNYLIEQGHEVVCYVPMKAYKFNNKGIKGFLKTAKFSLGNTFVRKNEVNWFDNKFSIKLVPTLKEKYIEDGDVTIATAWPTAYNLNEYSSRKGKKVYFVQDYEIWSGDVKDVEGSYKLPLNKVTITNKLSKQLKSRFNVDSEIIYNGIDENEILKENKQINKNKVIAMLYNESPNKGAKEAIEILRRIKNEYENLQIILFGYKKGEQIPENFEFYENPQRDQLISIYRKADIYLFPSKHEAWGLPVIEAMASKCAVVGMNVGCIEELCTDGKNALIAESNDYEELEKKLRIVIEDDNIINTIGLEGYELAKTHTWKVSFEKFEKYLINICSKTL